MSEGIVGTRSHGAHGVGGGTRLLLIPTSPARSGPPWEPRAGTFGNRLRTTHTGVVSSCWSPLFMRCLSRRLLCQAPSCGGRTRTAGPPAANARSAEPPLHGQPGFARLSSVSWRGCPCLWSLRRGVDYKLYPFICLFHGLQPQNPSISTSVGLGKTAPNSQGLSN